MKCNHEFSEPEYVDNVYLFICQTCGKQKFVDLSDDIDYGEFPEETEST